MLYNLCKFLWDQSVMKGIFLGEHTIFSFVSGLPKEGYSRIVLLTALALQPV